MGCDKSKYNSLVPYICHDGEGVPNMHVLNSIDVQAIASPIGNNAGNINGQEVVLLDQARPISCDDACNIKTW